MKSIRALVFHTSYIRNLLYITSHKHRHQWTWNDNLCISWSKHRQPNSSEAIAKNKQSYMWSYIRVHGLPVVERSKCYIWAPSSYVYVQWSRALVTQEAQL